MTGRALVIRMAGNQEIANAIAAGMVQTAPTREELEMVKAELKALREREAVLGVRVIRDRDYWIQKAEEARYCYGDNPKHGLFSRMMLGLVGMVCESVYGWYQYLLAWNKQ